MKTIIKQGRKLTSSANIIGNELIVNLKERWVYEDSEFYKNRLYIQTLEGDIELAFSGVVNEIEFNYQEKDQLIFKIYL
jgi:hypothetical protein